METESIEVTEGEAATAEVNMERALQLFTGEREEIQLNPTHLEKPRSNGEGNNDLVGEGPDMPQELDEVIVEEELAPPFQNIPCLGCGSNCFIKPEPNQQQRQEEEQSLHSGTELLIKFFQFLKVKRVNYWISPEIGRAPICGKCRNQLSLLLDLEQKLKELENDFQNGIKEFRKMCQEAEDVFRRNGVYDKDKRYFDIRKQVVKGLAAGRPRKEESKEGIVKKELVPSRRSERLPKSIRTKGTSALSKFSPVVAVSSTDRAKADEFQIVKTEVISGNELDNDTNDGFQYDSPMPMDTQYGDGIGFGNDPLDAKNADVFQQQTVDKRSKLKGRLGGGTHPDYLNKIRAYKETRKPKRKPKKKKRKPLEVLGAKRGRGRPPVVRPTPKKKKGPSDAERKVFMIDDPEQINSFIFGDNSGDEEAIEITTKPKRKKKDVDYQPEDKNAEEEEADEDDIFDENERTQHNPETGEYTTLHITYTPLHDGSDKFKCSECDEPVARSSFRKHTFKYHTSRFKCKECGHCEGSPAHLKRHIRYKHQDKKPKNECPICGKPCSGIRDRFMNHITTHYSEQDKADAIARGERLRMWKDRRNIQCSDCGKKFTSKKELERHTLSRHSRPEDAEMMMRYKELCPDCGKMVDKHYMNLHRLRSHNVSMDANLSVGNVLDQDPQAHRRFICTVCDKRFFKSKELVRHKMSVHDKNYPFKCELCPRAFLLKRQLDRHMNTHNNFRPFPCTFCPSAFFTNGNLTRHIGTYHTEGANPKRKAYVRGSTNFNAKRFQPDAESGPSSDGARQVAIESSQLKQEIPQSSRNMQIPVSSKPTTNESELIESFIQYQSAMSAGGATSVPAPVIQPSSSSASFMQDLLFIRQHQHHPTQ